MVPVRVPIIDYENPFYCPDPLQLHPIDVSDANWDVNFPTSPSFRKSATVLAHNHESMKNYYLEMGTSSPSMHAFGRGLDCVSSDISEKRVVRRKFTSISYDSSPCARFPPCLDRKSPTRKRARYTSRSFEIPNSTHKEHHGIKQEPSSPVLPSFLNQVERVQPIPMEGYQTLQVSPHKCNIDSSVTTRALLLRLESVFPRMGFREAADSDQHIWLESNAEYRSERHQVLVDLLGKKGALNEYVLTAIHDADCHYLDLGPTMRGVNDLALPLGDVMRALGQAGWFKALKTLSFAEGRFRDDFALVHIRSLCQLETLILANTGIGNEGVFHIVALKRNLRHLDLSGNPSINDDSIPALIFLDNLQYISVSGTGILMPGLRKLAVAMKEGERVMDIKIPSVCKDYVDTMHKQYLLHPAPPLVSDPGVVSVLSKAALSRNIEAHAAINPSIVSTGPHNELEERLTKILEVRSLDLVVRKMLGGRDGS